MAQKAVPAGVVTLWDSALGHTIRDAVVSFGATILLILLNALQGVHLTGQWAEFGVFVPVIVTLIKGYFHIKDPNLPNLPTSLEKL